MQELHDASEASIVYVKARDELRPRDVSVWIGEPDKRRGGVNVTCEADVWRSMSPRSLFWMNMRLLKAARAEGLS